MRSAKPVELIPFCLIKGVERVELGRDGRGEVFRAALDDDHRVFQSHVDLLLRELDQGLDVENRTHLKRFLGPYAANVPYIVDRESHKVANVAARAEELIAIAVFGVNRLRHVPKAIDGHPRAPSRVFTYCAAAAISYSYIPGRVARMASATASAPIRPLLRMRSRSYGVFTQRRLSSSGLTSVRVRPGAAARRCSMACAAMD
jgi:hypothetical protein